uniref:RNA-directed DNA polymerase n=1 Tax=Piper yellow mottle virus TaxID=262957 RepID=A0A345G0A0_9VIRU|nr:ORF3 [Piper yellow mottle virus]
MAQSQAKTLVEDQITQYRQNQRRMHNLRQAVRRLTNSQASTSGQEIIDQSLDPQKQLLKSMTKRASIVPAEVLYHSRKDDVNHKVYIHRSEEALSVTEGNQVDRTFIQEESHKKLVRSGIKFIHLGVLQVRLQILHRKEEGTLALVVFRDNRWKGDKGIIATMEVDLTKGCQMVYIIPDIMMTVNDFYHNIHISILTRGYEGWQHGEANLLVTRGMIGRLSNTPNVGFAYDIQEVVDYFITHGVNALPGAKYDTTRLQGQQWILKKPELIVPTRPGHINSKDLVDGTVSLRFSNYTTQASTSRLKYNAKDEEIQSDEEILAYLHHERQEVTTPDVLGVIRLTPEARLPIRTAPSAAGYNLFGTERLVIQPGEKQLQRRTGIAIRIPEGHYGRIAARSSAAWQLGIVVGAGVIDADFQGEIKVLISNLSNSPVEIEAGDAVAQLVLERISTPSLSVWRVFTEETVRGTASPLDDDLPYPQLRQQQDDTSPLLAETGGHLPNTNSEEEEAISPAATTPEDIQDDLYQHDLAAINTEGPVWDNSEEEEEGYAAEEEEEIDDMEYPHVRALRLKMQEVFSTQSEISQYRPPQDTAMGPSCYPPAVNITNEAGPSRPMFEGYNKTGVRFKHKDLADNWTLPSAQQQQGAVFVIPTQLGLFDSVFARWESITKNLVAAQGFTDPADKVDFIENLLGEAEKLTWIQWRSTYQAEYQEMMNSADGRAGTENILSQVRRIFALEDPATGSTKIQDEAYRDLEQLTCSNLKDLVPFLNDYLRLAAKTGRMFLGTELSEKLWMKLPGNLGRRIKEAFDTKYKGNEAGVIPRILFTHKYLEDQCKEAAFQRSLKGMTFCNSIPIPGYYSKEKKMGVRRSTTYKGKPHSSHVRIEKRKHLLRNKNCKCYLCGEEGHFAKDCNRNKRDIRRVAIFEGLELPKDHDVVSVSEGEDDSDAIYSVSEGEDGSLATMTHFINVFFEEDRTYWVGKAGSWQPMIKVSQKVHDCQHCWMENTDVPNEGSIQCLCCKRNSQKNFRIHCPICKVTSCGLCSKFCFDKSIQVKKEYVAPYNPRNLLEEQQKYIEWCELEMKRLKESINQDKELRMENERLQLENRDLKKQILKLQEGQKMKALLEDLGEEYDMEEEINVLIEDWDSEKVNEELDSLEAGINKVGVIIPEEKVCISKEGEKVKPISKSMLIKFQVRLEIPDVPEFTVNAILDTGATTCCIDERVIPQEALEANPYLVHFRGINSKTTANKKLKYGRMIIGDQQFKVPYTYAFPMTISDDIQMILGCNFIRAMHGGVRIEGNEVTFYKYVTKIMAQQGNTIISTEAIPEEEEYSAIEEICTGSVIHPEFGNKYQRLIEDMKSQGYIGEEPMKYWQKNQVTCKLEIKNPDLIIEDRPLKHVTPAMHASFLKHIDALLKIKVIRPSKSRHRTCAFIVNSGTTIDPVTGKEVKGKERLVFNYKRLNDNTNKDQYSLPGINTIISKVGNSKIFSKFDLKSGFHQVAMDPESIEWTAFSTPNGLYEWLVMPFGLKNAPAVFQRKMDNCFKGMEDFIVVYIDDILVFSENMKDHAQHLVAMLEVCKKNGLILSPTKMKIGLGTIDFLGATIGNSKVKLQEHIVKKILDFNTNGLEDKKNLRSWLGILNYARAYIPNLGRILGPLYAKVSPTGEKKMNQQDWGIVAQIKKIIQELPELELPPENCCIVIETDGCMNGWGGVCKWKPMACDPKSTEKICAYCSGKFDPPKSTIDAEIHAVMNSLEKLKIYYLDKKEIVIRTDCQAIISFFNKSSVNKPSRVRWIGFTDYITGLGIDVKFQHIDGKENSLADSLSRLTCSLIRQWHQLEPVVTTMEAALVQEQLNPTPGSTKALRQALDQVNQWLSSTSSTKTPSRGSPGRTAPAQENGGTTCASSRSSRPKPSKKPKKRWKSSSTSTS